MENHAVTTAEQAALAGWSGWGATPSLFDERPQASTRFAAERAELLQLIGEDAYRAARASTLNAHYTDPDLADAIWSAVQALGFDGGSVLEPGCGSGNLLAGAPAGSRLVGVEVDPFTARIAKARFPEADIRAESFADTRLPEVGFDLVVGNVPFGKHKLHDPVHNPKRRQPIHNHFILKSLAGTRPGGLVAVVTSQYTMDGRDEVHRAARRQMAAYADLIGAVRLPNGAHQQAAGTDVLTDLLVFRRRPAGQPPVGAAFADTRPTLLPAAVPGGPTEIFPVNEYFLDHPSMVLGRQLTATGRGRPKLIVHSEHPDVPAALHAALQRLVAEETVAPAVVLRSATQDQEGLFVDAGDRFYQVRDGRRVHHDVAVTQVGELRALIGLREAILAVLDEEATHRADTPHLDQLRTDLNRRYDQYVATHGPINRFTAATHSRVDRKTGETVGTERRTYPRMGGFRDDPFFPYVAALERFHDEDGTAEKAEVFHRRVIAIPNPVQRVTTADDAVVVCWDRHNEIRRDVIAGLLDLPTTAQAREALHGLVFDDPDSGTLIRKAEYLSGNVRAKLAAAERAASSDPRFADNVQALRAVVPRDLAPGEISARLGSPWIAASYVQQFLREILDDPGIQVTNVGAAWSVTGGAKTGVLATTVWGTQARTAIDLADNLLNSQQIEITKTVGTGTTKRTVRDQEATAFAQAKSEQLDARFRAWLWEDPDRAVDLGRIYNDRFNARVVRTYDGEHITAPGMSAAFTLRSHQMAAVARIRNSRGVGLFHGTGAGKTLEMIVGGMELVRLGLVSKPAYVVPKGVLAQFRREFLQAYPRAKVLAADSEDLIGDKRRQFVARCSTGDWDAIIISNNAFTKIPVSREVKVAYLNKQLDRLKAHLENAEGADRYTVKDIENQVAALTEQIQEQLAAPSDPGVEFERTGIGYLFIDEAHVYKNLRVISAIRELAHPGNQITADLEMKLDYLRRISDRVVTLATATPIDNSPSEILTMTKYAAPELLTEMGIEEDDQYHAAFIQPRRRIEMRPDGSGFESRTRHSRFVNLPEQKQLMYSWADVKLKEHLDLGEPEIIGGQPEILAVPTSGELRDYLVTLAGRAKGVTSGHPDQRLNTKGDLRDDNILWISTDGRAASLDLRLAGLHTGEPQKIDVAADWLIGSWTRHRDDVYYEPDGTPETVRGSLHLVFCDLGVPHDRRWSVYEGFRDALVARGMPAAAIRFAQDASNRGQKEQLDQDARDGKITVLIGSRAGLGTGRNIQRRVIAVMQLDPTWKLSPVVQSLGRGQRQGNANPAIHHVFVVTEGSYDPFLWQKVDDKARFTRQMLDPHDTTTRILDAADDNSDGKIDPAVMFAVAAGRPELLELHRIEETVGALSLEQRIWHDEQVTLTATVEQNRRSIAALHSTITNFDTVIDRRRDTRGDLFQLTLHGTTYDSRADAGTALIGYLHPLVRTTHGRREIDLGELGGLDLAAAIEPDLLGHRALLSLDRVADSTISLSQKDLDTLAAGSSADRIGLIRQLENRLAAVDALRAKQLDIIDRLTTNIARATARIGLPFPRQADLDEQAAQLAALHYHLETLDTTPTSSTGPIAAARPAASAAQGNAALPAASRNVSAATPAGSAQAGTPTMQVWAVTSPDRDDGRLRTTLVSAELAAHELDQSSHEPGTTIDRDGQRATARRADGSVAYTAGPLDLPWRSWQPGEADRVDLGDGVVWRMQVTADGRSMSTLGGPGDARSVLRQAQAGGSPVAVTDWGVVTVHRARPVAFVHSDAAIPDVAEVPTAVASTAAAPPAAATPTTGSTHDDIAQASSDSRRVTYAPQPASPRIPAPPETQRERRGHPFYPPAAIAATIPPLGGTDRHNPADVMIGLRYFGASFDAWVVEYDPTSGQAYGYVSLGDPDNAEWGSIDLTELERLTIHPQQTTTLGLDIIIERDLYWTPVPATDANLPGYTPHASASARPAPHPATASLNGPPQPPNTLTNSAVTAVEAPGAATTPAAQTAQHPADTSPTRAPADEIPGTSPEISRSGPAISNDRAEFGDEVAADSGPHAAETAASAPAASIAAEEPTTATALAQVTVTDDVRPVVRGTRGGPGEQGLRGLLKQYRFRWNSATREWRYTGRPDEREAALRDIRRWLATHTQPAAAAPTPPAAMVPTLQQQAIIEAFQSGKTVAVQALAGTGKTSTLLMLANIRPGDRIAYIAFNASIAAEATRKMPRHVQSGTAHSFAREALLHTPLRDKVAHVRSGLRWPEQWADHLHITDTTVGEDLIDATWIAAAVQATLRQFRESDDDTIEARHLPPRITEENPGLAPAVLDYARTAWADVADPAGHLFFDHDDYLKLWALTQPVLPHKVIFFDEAQDINPVLRRLIQDQPRQIVVVGDSNQSIYGFRGAIDALKHWPADATLPLTQSWRFGDAVADVGNRFLTLLESPWQLTGNPALPTTIAPVERPDAVLARTNAGAVSAVIDGIDAGRHVALLGGGQMIKDIATAAIDLQAGRRTRHPDLSRFADWDEVRAYVEDPGHADAQSLRAFVNLVDRRGAQELLRLVQELVNENERTPDGRPRWDLMVSTVHKAKGREWDTVRIANDFPQPRFSHATGETILPGGESLRLAYVAVTRARTTLELGSLDWINEIGDLPVLAQRARQLGAPARIEPVTQAAHADLRAIDQRTTHAEAIIEPTAASASTASVDPVGRPGLLDVAETTTRDDESSPAFTLNVTSSAEHDQPSQTDLDPRLAPFTADERVVISNAVDDFAGFYAQGPLRTGADDTARYISEGHLRDLVERHGLAAVWRAATVYIEARPEVLAHDDAARAENRAQRHARAEQLARGALAAFTSGDYDLAEHLVELGTLTDPTFRDRPNGMDTYGTNWQDMTSAITRRRETNASTGGRPHSQSTASSTHTAARLARLDSPDHPGRPRFREGLSGPDRLDVSPAGMTVAANSTLTPRRVR